MTISPLHPFSRPPSPPSQGARAARLSLLPCILALLVLILLPQCTAPTTPPALAPQIDASLTRAAAFLLVCQSKDGAWRSDTYGAMKDGLTLTPHVLDAFTRLPQTGRTSDACRSGTTFLVDQLNPDGTLRNRGVGLPYLVYSVAGAADVVARRTDDPRRLTARNAYLAILRRHQFNEDLGWTENDLLFGGWGYSNVEPRKPAGGDPRGAALEANLSATVYALEAFRAAGVPHDDPALRKARTFLSRVHNFGRNAPAFDDGGFYFTPLDALRNKAGLANGNPDHPRFASYGTMTADGIRSLAILNDRGDARTAAFSWLESHFRADEQPGPFARDQQLFKLGMYYYYCASVAQALADAPATLHTRRGDVRWADALARALLGRQQSDGSWTNAYTDSKEDDPLVATSQAITALTICRTALTR